MHFSKYPLFEISASRNFDSSRYSLYEIAISYDPYDMGHTGQSINELDNDPSSYRQKGIYFEWVLMK